ncbi:trehalose-phosphatase [Halovivax limisalsi]|uniref:trehalose-phosphatase n=1 Tax=Halovivax limisalsi TaxID=1453760 RepID=UPI001FFC525A|nr:trehalose-phosphatase [Halovivax limisalsi]
MTDAIEDAATGSGPRAAETGDRSRSSAPRPVEAHDDALRRSLAEAAHVLCCLDFDGTLAPIVDRPDEARMLPANRRAIKALVDRPHVTVAVVSGRELGDLESRVTSSVILAGNHGLECSRPNEARTGGQRTVHPIARAARPRIQYCCGLLSRTLSGFPGVSVEYKELSGTVHYRNAPPGLEPVVDARVRAIVDRYGAGKLDVSAGKAIVEFTPSIDWDKGSLVELLQRDSPAGTVTLFVGDDTTDEDAFEVVEPDGYGILVGDPRPSAASLRLERPAAVARFVTRLDRTLVRPSGDLEPARSNRLERT